MLTTQSSNSSSTHSSIDELHRVIAAQNPFERPLFVKHQDIWEHGLLDVPSLNAHASDAVIRAIEQVRTNQRPSIGITITAEKGLGKSHLIGRIRRHLQSSGDALFVYMNEFSNLDRIKGEFLQTLAYSLKRSGSGEVMQWQELATALLNDVEGKTFTPKQAVEQVFPFICKKTNGKPFMWLNRATQKILDRKPEIHDPYIVQAILWTLSKPHANFAINWLAGKGIAKTHVDEMGFPEPSSESQEKDFFDTACQVLNLIGEYKTLVVCFDELDSLGRDENTLPKPMIVASLAKDVANNLKRGIVLTAMYPQTWHTQIKHMPQADAVIDRIAEHIIDLKYLNPDDVVTLVSTWLKRFYEEKGLVPLHSVYPFAESELREMGEEKPTFRAVLQECRAKFRVPDDIGIDKNENKTVKNEDKTHQNADDEFIAVNLAFQAELADLEDTIEDYLEDKDLLASALWFGFASLIGKTIDGIEVLDIQSVDAKSVDQGYIDFRIVGREGRKIVKIGVSVVQIAGGTGVSAALKRLVDYKKFDLTRGCLVRSKSISSKATKAQEYLRQLLVHQKGEWVSPIAAHVMPLLAILFVYGRMEDYELTEEQVDNFLDQERITIENPLLQEILSKPTGQYPRNVADEDLLPSIPTFTSDGEENVHELAELLN